MENTVITTVSEKCVNQIFFICNHFEKSRSPNFWATSSSSSKSECWTKIAQIKDHRSDQNYLLSPPWSAFLVNTSFSGNHLRICLFKQATGQTIPASACDQLIENNLQTNQCKEEVDTENVSHSTKERSIANASSIQFFSTRPPCCRSFTFSSSTQCPSTPTQAQHWHGRHWSLHLRYGWAHYWPDRIIFWTIIPPT